MALYVMTSSSHFSPFIFEISKNPALVGLYAWEWTGFWNGKSIGPEQFGLGHDESVSQKSL